MKNKITFLKNKSLTVTAIAMALVATLTTLSVTFSLKLVSACVENEPIDALIAASIDDIISSKCF